MGFPVPSRYETTKIIYSNGSEYDLIPSNDGGLTEEIKEALLQIARKVAYIDDKGSKYYDDLYNALYPGESPEPEVMSITATYTQSGTVYDTDTLDSLKSDLVVTANYSDSTSETVTDYTLSGTLTEGTSVVTVSYGVKTATFSVTVSSAPLVPAGYTQVEYAKLPTDAGSNIVINTELILTGTGEAVIDVDFMSETATTGYHHVIGCAQAASPSAVGIAVGISDTANTLVCYNGLTASVEPNGGSSLNGVRIHAVGTSSTGNASITDGTLTNTQTGTTRVYNQYPVSLFGIKKGTTAQTLNQFYGRIYRAKITENNTLLMDAVPCVRTNDNAVGFYDIVRDTFITHSSLVAGDSV